VPRSAYREDVRRLRERGAQVVEVLPRDEYEWLHIEGAINLPLKELDAESVRRLDPTRAVITYCNDFQ
jgi:rhodanese-related sulfurtransferase